MRHWGVAFVTALAYVSLVLCSATSVFAQQAVAENLSPEYRSFVENVNKAKARKMWGDGITFRLPTAQEVKETQGLWPTIPSEKNAAFVYANAIAEMDFQDDLQWMPGSCLNSEPYGGDITPLKKFTARHSKAIALVKEAASMDSCWFSPIFPEGDDVGESETFFCSTATACLSGIVYDAAFVAEVEGKHEEAIKLYFDLFRMANHLYKDAAYLSANDCGTMSSQGLERLIEHTSLSTETLWQIIETCAASENSLGDLGMSIPKAPLEMAHDWKGVDWREMVEEYSKYMQVTLAETSQAQISIETKAVENTLKVLKDPLWTQLAPEYNLKGKLEEGLPAGTDCFLTDFMPSVLRGTGEYNARLRALQLRAAIHLYQKKYEKLPETQDQLCPEFLAELPMDPFSGKPFKYKKTEDGWVLWSVGTNLKDDDADETSPADELGPMTDFFAESSLTDKRDIVFRIPLPTNAQVRSEQGPE